MRLEPPYIILTLITPVCPLAGSGLFPVTDRDTENLWQLRPDLLVMTRDSLLQVLRTQQARAAERTEHRISLQPEGAPVLPRGRRVPLERLDFYRGEVPLALAFEIGSAHV